MPNTASIKIGWDPVLSAQGLNYVQTNRDEEPEWIVCTEGDNIHAINYQPEDKQQYS